MNEHDLEYLREKLALLGEPELPPALSAAALFQRMEEGSLSLPEEDPLEETAAAGKAPAGESPSQGGEGDFLEEGAAAGHPPGRLPGAGADGVPGPGGGAGEKLRRRQPAGPCRPCPGSRLRRE